MKKPLLRTFLAPLPLFLTLIAFPLAALPDFPTGWIQRSPALQGTEELRGVAYGQNMFVAVGDHARLLTSSNGVNWVSRYLGTTIPPLNAVTFGNGTFVVVGAEYTLVLTSSDGAVWT